MCNYMGYIVSRQHFIRLKQIEKEFGVAAALESIRGGFAYSDWACIVASDDKKSFEIVNMHWEFIPPFVVSMADMQLIRKGINPKTGVKKAPIPWLNAKAENLFVNDKGHRSMWADAARNNRCLIVASHFFEWRWFKPEGEKKEISYPYMIDFFNKEKPLFMAGIYNKWTDVSTGEMLNTFAHVTTEGIDVMKQIHNRKGRQPTILTEDLAWSWIADDLSDNEITAIAKRQFSAEDIKYYTIGKDFRETGCFDEVVYPELPQIQAA